MKTEKDLAIELGIDRKILAGWRKEELINGWEKKGNAIVYDSDAEHGVRNHLQKEICAAEISEPLPAPDSPKELTITKIPLNPKLVICGDIRVRVRENKNFLLGMKVNARPSMDSEQLWVMQGRCPRWRGRY
jgi:hypothetical protein